MPAGINDLGEIAGSFADGTGVHGFHRDPAGTFTTIDLPGAFFTAAGDINNSGEIVGSVSDATGFHGYLRSAGGALTSIAVPGASFTFSAGINDVASVVGYFYDATGPHGFLRDVGGTFTTFDKAGASLILPNDIDNAGVIVGSFTDSVTGRLHGFVRDAVGAFTTLDMPGAFATEVMGIGNDGIIVGQFRDNTSALHGFFRDAGGTFTALEVDGAYSTQAFRSNTGGFIVGTFLAFVGADSKSHGLLVATQDVTPPTLVVPDTIYEDGTSPAGAVVTYAVSAVDDADPNPTVACIPTSGSVFPLLLTTVSCTATDAAGNNATKTFDVVVKDANWQLQDLQGLVGSWNLGKLGTSLSDKLEAARKFIAANKLSQACDNLNSFLNQVNAQTGKGLTIDQATELVERAKECQYFCV